MADKDRIIQELGLRKFGVKGWMRSEETVCPQCGRSDKSGILFTGDSGIFNCMRCSLKMPLNKFLRDIGREELVSGQGYTTSSKRLLRYLQEEQKEEEIREMPEKRLPVGFKEVDFDEYLESRGFLERHYQLFKPGTTRIDLKRKHCVIFQIFDENGKRVGWLSRSKLSKEWHKHNLTEFKKGNEELVLRYDNSPNTDFSSILGGVQELTDKTDTVILVEGLFDKVNVDRELSLNDSEEIKCLFTFGDSLKKGQIDKLRLYPNVTKIYLLYDYNTIENSKQYGLMLMEELGVDVRVCEIRKEGKDPGNLTSEELLTIIDESVGAVQFKIGKLNYV